MGEPMGRRTRRGRNRWRARDTGDLAVGLPELIELLWNVGKVVVRVPFVLLRILT